VRYCFVTLCCFLDLHTDSFLLSLTLIGYYVIVFVILVVVALTTIFHKQIVHWLTPFTKWVHECVFFLAFCVSLYFAYTIAIWQLKVWIPCANRNSVCYILPAGNANYNITSFSQRLTPVILPAIWTRNCSHSLWISMGAMDRFWNRCCWHLLRRSWKLLVRVPAIRTSLVCFANRYIICLIALSNTAVDREEKSWKGQILRMPALPASFEMEDSK